MVDFSLIALAGLVHKSVDGFRGGVQKGDQAVRLRGVVGFREGHGVMGDLRSDKSSCVEWLKTSVTRNTSVVGVVLNGTKSW